jgi:hypothetical protein
MANWVNPRPFCYSSRVERWTLSGAEAELTYDTWLDLLGQTKGEWFKVLVVSPHTKPYGPDREIFDDFSKPEPERVDESAQAFADGRLPFTVRQMARREDGARLVRVCVYDDDAGALADPEYRRTLEWLSNSYARSFAHAEEMHWVPLSKVTHLGVPDHDVGVFRFSSRHGDIWAAATNSYKDNGWDVASREFIWQGRLDETHADDVDRWLTLRDELDDFISTGRYWQQPTFEGEFTPDLVNNLVLGR